jgi:hypothetical protein
MVMVVVMVVVGQGEMCGWIGVREKTGIPMIPRTIQYCAGILDDGLIDVFIGPTAVEIVMMLVFLVTTVDSPLFLHLTP